MVKDAYYAGFVDAFKRWGSACSKQANCEECPIGIVKAGGITCSEFAKQFPEKFASLITEMDTDAPISFFEEFCMRFPNCNINVDGVSQLACRKAIYEGYLECDKPREMCIDCWLEPFYGDVTEQGGTEEESGEALLENLDFLSD